MPHLRPLIGALALAALFAARAVPETAEALVLPAPDAACTHSADAPPATPAAPDLPGARP